jgi:hypothetical protein
MLGRQRVRTVKVILRRLLIFATDAVVPKYRITMSSSWCVTSCLQSDSTHAQVCENRGIGTPVKGKIVQCERFIGPEIGLVELYASVDLFRIGDRPPCQHG